MSWVARKHWWRRRKSMYIIQASLLLQALVFTFIILFLVMDFTSPHYEIFAYKLLSVLSVVNGIFLYVKLKK